MTSNHGYTVVHPSAAGALDTVLPVADVLVPVDARVDVLVSVVARVDVLVSVVARADVLVSEVARVDVLVPGVTGMAERISRHGRHPCYRAEGCAARTLAPNVP